MINKKYFKYVFVAMMTMCMALALTLISTMSDPNELDNFLSQWFLKASTDFVVAFPTALAVAPIANWAAVKVTKHK
ncbi:DUF2798 domain-containing protein [Gilvimarinus sp. SDUM040013]|uniref:DUF2798 domain-containing protein n=1 Tax=Gilvimarinus gilvus TaxID=3058038 RepID=A0ABU4RX15_9GAMM|nr:DUF2798 domain-containing protein [Gilvimarinus sp. SDUM040013]MDO3386872.1 DUF2798 domain-containing protein [Gilvimarinus sp. SDUM040013]MDX6848198.1 DUF2798 domain-containing protein [Gilvimarinus sp. SDUM040013]